MRFSRNTAIAITLLLGTGTAILSILASSVDWISELCGFLGNTCKDTAEYRLLDIPVPIWGIGYYLLLIVLFRRECSWLFFGVMAGVGAEIVLIRTLVEMHSFCIFCVANSVLMLVLLLLLFDRKRVYEMAAIILLFFVLTDALISNERNAESRTADPKSIVAMVAGNEITLGEVNRALAPQIHLVESAIYEIKKDYIETWMNETLLELEAEKQGLSPEALKATLLSDIPAPEKLLIDLYYETKLYKTLGNFGGSEEEIRNQIQTHLQEQSSDEAVQNYCDQLRNHYPVSFNLQEPPLLLTSISLEDCPSVGASNAPVTVVEFLDYACPHCRRNHAVVDQIREKYQDQIRWVFKDYPLKRHHDAKKLALATRCADQQGQFLAYYDLLFSKDEIPKAEELMAFAEELNLDMPQFSTCLSDPQLEVKLDQDIEEAKRAGISSTPSFLVNGELHEGMPTVETFSALIEDALKETSR